MPGLFFVTYQHGYCGCAAMKFNFEPVSFFERPWRSKNDTGSK
jgi:hypothetical protein